MDLSNDELKGYDRDRLKLPTEERHEYEAQADRLIKKLREHLAADDDYKVKKIIRAGSLTKGTILQPSGSRSCDADIAIYFRGSLEDFDLGSMQADVIEMLLKVYPNKKREDFTEQPRTLGVKFVESGLEVDLVPVIAHPDNDDYGWQPAPEDRAGTPLLTSVQGQLDFVKRRKDADPLYRTLVRFIKKWRNEQEIEHLGSFAIELLLAYVQDQQGPVPSIVDGLRRLFLSLARGLREPIAFAENGNTTTWPSGVVVLVDPVNNDNNVTAKISEVDRSELVGLAEEAWTALWDARTESDEDEVLELWKSVFGRDFRLAVPA